MKNLFLIKNPEIFQGEKYIKNNKNYFEGWYFKNTNDYESISFIPGISITKNNKIAFIQVITTDSSYYIKYDINDFIYSNDPFYIKIGNNFFSKDKLKIDIRSNNPNLVIEGEIIYSSINNIKTNLFNPNIMGPFSYITFMECNHAILNMKSKINGIININKKKICFNNSIGYIEKDWGCSFPKSYIWCQGNNFSKKDASFMLSIAHIPFKIFNFRGLICSLIIDNQEYRFATYNGAKIKRCDIDKNKINIVLEKGIYTLYIESKLDSSFKLLAPIKGKMEKDIFEGLSSSINIKLKKKKKTIFNDTSTSCGLEIVK